MRFMMLMIPKGYENALPGAMPDAKAIERMMKYNKSLENAGVLIGLDGLHPPSMGARVTFSSNKPTVTSGPFAGVKEVLGGYWMINVKSKEEAVEWAKKCPASQNEIIEVRQVQEMTDFSDDIKDASSEKTSKSTAPPSQLIDERIVELGDWRGEMLTRIRKLIKEADPEVSEEWKWRGVPVWSHDGMICTGETYKDHVKITFAKGASLKDPDGLFTQDGTVRRAIDFYESDKLNEKSLKALILAAVTLNKSGRKTSRNK